MSDLNHIHARRARLAWLLPILAALLLLACSLPALAGAPAPATQPPDGSLASTAAPGMELVIPPGSSGASVLPNDPRAAVIYVMQAQLKAFRTMPYRVTTKIDSGNTQMETFFEIESPQRILMVSPSGSTKIVDGKCYEKRGDGVWQDCLNPAVGEVVTTTINSMMDESMINTTIEMIQTVTLIGAETVDGIPARVYEYTYAGDQSGVHAEGTVRLWAAENSGLPLKQVSAGTTAGYSATSTQTIEYDPAITVRAP
jgi:hypothetical protein